MSPTSLNFTSLAAGAVTPVSGHNYTIENLAYAHLLDNSQSALPDGNPVLGWSQNSPETSNQIVQSCLITLSPLFLYDWFANNLLIFVVAFLNISREQEPAYRIHAPGSVYS